MAGTASRRNGLKGGRPKGAKSWSTLSKEESREVVRKMILENLGPMVAAQTSNAQGLKYLVTRDKKTGKFTRIGPDGIEGAYERGDLVELWEKDPCVQAFTDLLNRALDKPKEQQIELHVTTDDEVFKRLTAGRQHARHKR